MPSSRKTYLLKPSLSPLLACIIISAICALGACQKADPSVSQPLHIEGQFERQNAAGFVDCHINAPSADSLSAMQTTVNGYIGDLAVAIMNRSNESLARDGRAPLFAGDLAPEKFCFVTPANVLPEINASAMTSRREINFKPYSFLALPHEPALAAIMCHELAHVTMRHSTTKDVRPDIESALMSSPGFDDRFKKSVDICNSLTATVQLTPELTEKLFGRTSSTYQTFLTSRNEILEFVDNHYFELAGSFGHMPRSYSLFFCRNRAEAIEALNSVEVSPEALAQLNPGEQVLWNNWLAEKTKLETTTPAHEGDITPHAALEFLNELAKQLDTFYATGRNSMVNWKEQEADEVGFEICLRAGVDVSSFAALHRYMIAEEEKAGKSTCLADIEAGRIPSRKLGTHPSACWRIFDIEKREQGEHASYYQDLLARIPRQEILGTDRLEQVLNVVRPQNKN